MFEKLWWLWLLLATWNWIIWSSIPHDAKGPLAWGHALSFLQALVFTVLIVIAGFMILMP